MRSSMNRKGAPNVTDRSVRFGAYCEQSELTQKSRPALFGERLRDIAGRSETYETDAKTGSWCEEGDSNPYTLSGVRT